MNGASPTSAVLIGATGLVGSALLQHLLADPRFDAVTVLGRRTTGVTHEKLTEHLIDFRQPSQWSECVRGDVLFSALGTTRKAAGSLTAQYEVDHTYQLQVAKAAREHGVSTYVLVSSAGASANARMFYPRMKGELERDTEALGFPRTRFMHPGPLDGHRSEHRPGEQWMLRVLRPLSKVLPPVARPIHASIVARACITAAFDARPGVVRYAPHDLFAAGQGDPKMPTRERTGTQASV